MFSSAYIMDTSMQDDGQKVKQATDGSQMQPIQLDPATVKQFAKPQIVSTTTSRGTPEAGPVQAGPVEVTPALTEYGYEALQQIENAGEQKAQNENREATPQAIPSSSSSRPIKKVVSEETTARKQPKFFGYNVPPKLANDFGLIKSKKGKGSPQKARTWILMLLDRLLKKQSLEVK